MNTCVPAEDVTVERSKTNSDLLDLVLRAKNGEEEAFAQLYNLHKRRVYSLCLLMTGDVSEAEDLTQNVFIQVFRKIGTFRGDSAFPTWLYRVAANTVLMKLRKRTPPHVSLDAPVTYDDLSSVQRDLGGNDLRLSGVIDRIVLTEVISDLPEGCRTIFVLHDVEGYQHHEIAQLLHCSAGNSKSQLHKARMKIRKALLSQKRAGARAKSEPAGRLPQHIAEAPRVLPSLADACSIPPSLRQNSRKPWTMPNLTDGLATQRG